ncbi:hypothetical protein [Endozoicomonas sp.]|uniref:hypothetical protein n=1 Tax=Endozoicomonas sp. TaxID=1892382 RepID=UPI0028868896|nr:hypothetical protein [Endozoicomonas sp.]
MTRNNPEPMAKIVSNAVSEITLGQFPELPVMGRTGLLNDFFYSWNRRFDISYDFKMLDFARGLANADNEAVFKLTACNSRDEVREYFARYIDVYCKKDKRVILKLSYNNNKIDSEWLPLDEYLAKTRKPEPSN